MWLSLGPLYVNTVKKCRDGKKGGGIADPEIGRQREMRVHLLKISMIFFNTLIRIYVFVRSEQFVIVASAFFVCRVIFLCTIVVRLDYSSTCVFVCTLIG